MPDDELIETYRGLWKIEESFRITKGVLETKLVYVPLEDHVNAHFCDLFHCSFDNEDHVKQNGLCLFCRADY